MVAFAEDDHIHEAANRLSITLPSSTRVSMEEYSPHGGVEFPLCVNDGGVDPPLYDANTFLQTHPLTKYNIQPREDEGQEILPQYSSAISLENVLLRKVELEGAIHRASNRNWKRVYATLQGTALNFYEYKPSRYFPGWLSEGAKGDVAIPALKGQFFKGYNLQYADVGIAADYYKKKFVVRVRAETEQFLLSCSNFETLVNWLQFLFAAINIAPPLDTRSLPRDFSIPRRRRRGFISAAAIAGLDNNPVLVREQYEIMRRQSPRVIQAPIPEGEVERPSSSHSVLAPTHSSEDPFMTTFRPTGRLTTLRTRSTSPLSYSSRSSSIAMSGIHPSISSDGKWRPAHHSSPAYDMIYAKRCMAILTKRSPRKSKYMIVNEKTWIVDWVTGDLTPCDPPDYGEITTDEGQFGKRPVSANAAA